VGLDSMIQVSRNGENYAFKVSKIARKKSFMKQKTKQDRMFPIILRTRLNIQP
jgi:hypothetical protein